MLDWAPIEASLSPVMLRDSEAPAQQPPAKSKSVLTASGGDGDDMLIGNGAN